MISLGSSDAPAVKERWRPIRGWTGIYDVSSLGRVRSLRIRNKQTDRRRASPLILKPGQREGYPTVNLKRGGMASTFFIHRLVLRTFGGPCPRGQESAHLNGRRHDARKTNLRWKTHVANMGDARRHGTLAHGTRLPQARLTPRTVRRIRALRQRGVGREAVARLFGVCRATIHAIDRRRNWAHVD